ncbi:MAG: ABC transporter ATP-binding protein [Bdellovibrio sp.]|nr:ABC transporter ATP-binding protein [Bdellovibrio sp.]
MSFAVEFKALTKTFNGVAANAGISLKVKKGSIHAIVGENGAGKSTAMKMLYGTYQPDSGEIWVDGKLWGGRSKPWSSPSDAIHCGIGMVHQHFMLAGTHTVLDNILLGVEPIRKEWKYLPIPNFLKGIDRTRAAKRLKEISQQYGMAVDLKPSVETLSVGLQQRIEILKLLYREASILILDEPTAVLTPQETSELFLHLRKLRDEGKTILIITHKLKEVTSLADRVTVFRGGRVVGEREIQETNEEDLATLMVGRKVNLHREPPPLPALRKPVLTLKNVSLGTVRKLRNLNLQVRGGEIVGISGVEGNGQSELLDLLIHPQHYSKILSGEIEILGRPSNALTTREIKSSGVGVIPEDRHKEGLLLDRPVRESFLLGLHRNAPFSRRGIVSEEAIDKNAKKAIREYDIRPAHAYARCGALSGGNQQKWIIAREFHQTPELLIAAQPTRGVDVGAIEFIHQKIIDARMAGSGVLLVSSELDEILDLSDRILVFYEGEIVGEFNRGEASEKVLGLRMGGAADL